jgi:hypothetical protein
MANKVINVRVLQHDTEDQIRIGVSIPVWDNMLDKVVESVVKDYEKETAWCGGFTKACDRFYKKIALVDSNSLQIVKVIYERKEEKQ